MKTSLLPLADTHTYAHTYTQRSTAKNIFNISERMEVRWIFLAE